MFMTGYIIDQNFLDILQYDLENQNFESIDKCEIISGIILWNIYSNSSTQWSEIVNKAINILLETP